MRNYDPENERIKRKYRKFLQYSQGKDEKTLNKVFASIAKFEATTNYKSFKAFHTDQAIAFQDKLNTHKKPDGKLLSKATIRGDLCALKKFFQWLSEQTGYNSKLKYSDADYFNQNRKDAAIAGARREKEAPLWNRSCTSSAICLPNPILRSAIGR